MVGVVSSVRLGDNVSTDDGQFLGDLNSGLWVRRASTCVPKNVVLDNSVRGSAMDVESSAPVRVDDILLHYNMRTVLVTEFDYVDGGMSSVRKVIVLKKYVGGSQNVHVVRFT